MSSHDGVSLVVFLYSRAHCCLPPSSCRKLFTHAFEADVVRARINAGRIIAATMTKSATVAAAILNFLDLRVITPNDATHSRGASDAQNVAEASSPRRVQWRC